jgi:hypothetical protein
VQRKPRDEKDTNGQTKRPRFHAFGSDDFHRIFAMVITAIYATWMSIVKGSRAAQKAAASVQRSRIALNALEASFRSARFFASNWTNYMFYADTSGDFAQLSLVTQLSPAIPGFGVHRGLGISRVNFSVQDIDGSLDLIMTHARFWSIRTIR